jgi:hypothetical protein
MQPGEWTTRRSCASSHATAFGASANHRSVRNREASLAGRAMVNGIEKCTGSENVLELFRSA